VAAGSRIALLDNIAAGVPGYGIHVFDQQRASGERRRVIADVLVEGNRLSASTEHSGLIVAMGGEGRQGSRVEGVTVRDNVFSGNNFAGVAIGANVSGVTIERNASSPTGARA